MPYRHTATATPPPFPGTFRRRLAPPPFADEKFDTAGRFHVTSKKADLSLCVPPSGHTVMYQVRARVYTPNGPGRQSIHRSGVYTPNGPGRQSIHRSGVYPPNGPGRQSIH
eukprot:scaffold10100_cov136-Isochrysis_galbana.AAC.1